MGVENAGLDITGSRGTVTDMKHGLITVKLDGSGAVVSAWPENLKMLRTAQVPARPPIQRLIDLRKGHPSILPHTEMAAALSHAAERCAAATLPLNYGRSAGQATSGSPLS